MKRSTKFALILAACLTAAGLFLCAGALAALDFDFARLSTVSFEETEYQVEDAFTQIIIDSAECDVRFLPSPDGTCRVLCQESEKVYHEVTVRDRTLRIQRQDQRAWYEYIGVFWTDRHITVYLPEARYDDLTLRLDTGDVEMPRDFSFGSASVETDTGDVSWQSTVSGQLSVCTDTGDISVLGIQAQSLTLQTDTGKLRLQDIQCDIADVESSTGDIRFSNLLASQTLRAEASTGDIRFDGTDAASIFVKTSTGDVTGTLLSGKNFLTETSTGTVRVPNTTGGECRITTSTGDIELDIRS